MPRIKHGCEDRAILHITTRTAGRCFYLRSEKDKRSILESLAFLRNAGRMKLMGFVVMDNHVHLVLGLTDQCTLGKLMRDFKTWTSSRNSSKPTGSPLWERRYDDNRIKTSRELMQILEYVHGNPVRAKLVDRADQYPWSSIHNYLQNGKEVIELDKDYWEYS